MRFSGITPRPARSFLFLFLLASLAAVACNSAPPRPAADSRGAASPPPAAPVKSVPKIVAFGDSLTAGYGLSESASYPALLRQKLAADGFEYDVVNAGVSGDTSAGGLRRIDWAMEGDVRIVIVELGANDILRGLPIDQMKKNLSQIIERAQSRGARVLLAGMEAPTNSGAEYRSEVHEAYADLAQDHQVALIPFFLEDVAGIDSLNQGDGIHPTAEGTRIVAETVYRSLRPLLE
jgi:acyl-CoA thioesterase-1